jgi:hypothetical protein
MGLIGLASGVAGLATGSVANGLNMLGVIGVGTLVVGGMTYASSDSARTTVMASGATAGVAAILFFAGGGLQSYEEGFNLLTVVGIATVVAAVVLAAAMQKEYAAAKLAADTKTCPDCANRVKQAARRCQHCNHVFSS